MSDKKKFRDTKVGAWLKDKAPDVLSLVSDVTPDGGVLDAVAGLIRGKEDMDPTIKMEFERMYLEERRAQEENVTRRWEADTKTQYWLPNNVRPVTAGLLVLSIILFAGIDAGSENFTMPVAWTDLLTTISMTVVAAYFGGRSYEKVKKAN